MGQYAGLSEIYDKMIGIDYDLWKSFLLDYFKKNNILYRGKKALELGCGTGNMTLKLKEAGFEITASDLSDDMLCVAQNKLAEKGLRVKFLRQDMTDFTIDKKFDFVFSFCDGFNYVTNSDMLKKSFKNIWNHLLPGGYFIFDISTLHKLKNIIENRTYTMVEKDVCYIWDNYFENDSIEMYITFFVKEGKLYRRFEEKHIQRGYEADYIKSLLADSGFSCIELKDGYSKDELKSDSERALIICKREEE